MSHLGGLHRLRSIHSGSDHCFLAKVLKSPHLTTVFLLHSRDFVDTHLNWAVALPSRPQHLENRGACSRRLQVEFFIC